MTDAGFGGTSGAVVIALDRWGRVLLQLRDEDLPVSHYPACWAIPGGSADGAEAPDECALREFEEETGHLFEHLTLFRVYRRDVDLPGALVDVQHVYFDDPDLELADLECNEGQRLDYFRPEDIPALALASPHRIILEAFLTSPAYRALFH